MKTRIIIVCLSVLLWCGCRVSGQRPKAVQPHPIFGNELLIIPKGNNVCGIKTHKDGVYMSGEIFMMMVEELTREREYYY